MVDLEPTLRTGTEVQLCLALHHQSLQGCRHGVLNTASLLIGGEFPGL